MVGDLLSPTVFGATQATFCLHGNVRQPFLGLACLVLFVALGCHGLSPLYIFRLPDYDMLTTALKDVVLLALTYLIW
jgi:hypothetical protein